MLPMLNRSFCSWASEEKSLKAKEKVKRRDAKGLEQVPIFKKMKDFKVYVTKMINGNRKSNFSYSLVVWGKDVVF